MYISNIGGEKLWNTEQEAVAGGKNWLRIASSDDVWY